MKPSLTNINRHIRSTAKKAVFSDFSRDVARKVVSLSRQNAMLEQGLEQANLTERVNRFASERLPEGKYFAKLTIKDWEKHRNKKFRLFQGNKVVYGNQIEPPARGFPLEYRNIIVTSRNPENFRLSIDAPFTLAISQGAFSTEQQNKYDAQYGVQQHGDVFYSLRGNTRNPKKILVTFPGFGPSTTRIPYAVSYLKALTDEDLKNTLMICFQDRYMVSGTYMMVDSAGRPLYPRVKAAIDGLLEKHGLSDRDMMLFGASKGGSIAIHYMQEYPAARLVVAVPQMNLPYYMNKPFFKHNLYLVPAIHDLDQPEDLLRSYFEEGRSIDYFYTNSDELSNHSLIEFARGIPGLTKYRVQGKHGEVARTALPSILNLMREFIGLGKSTVIKADSLQTYHDESFVFAQARIQTGLDQESPTNWYLEADMDGTVFRALMTSHSYDFVKYTDRPQRLLPAYDPIDSMNRIVGLQENGVTYRGNFDNALERSDEQPNNLISEYAHISGDTNEEAIQYTVVNGASFGRFRYISRTIDPEGSTVEVHFVDDLSIAPRVKPALRQTYPTSHLIVVEALDEMLFAQLFALRCVMGLKGERLRIVVHNRHLNAEHIKALVKTDWVHVQVVVVRGVEGLVLTSRPFSNWITKRRLNVLESSKNEMKQQAQMLEAQARSQSIRLPQTVVALKKPLEKIEDGSSLQRHSAKPETKQRKPQPEAKKKYSSKGKSADPAKASKEWPIYSSDPVIQKNSKRKKRK